MAKDSQSSVYSLYHNSTQEELKYMTFPQEQKISKVKSRLE